MARHGFAKLAALFATVSIALLVLPAPTASAGSCATAAPVVGGYFSGTLSGAGDSNFFSFHADEGQYVSIREYDLTPGVLFHLVLHSPDCADAAFNYNYNVTCAGCVHETLHYVIPYSGTWYVEVWSQMGAGSYDGDLFEFSPGETESCNGSSLLSTGAESCNVLTPWCPVGACTFEATVTITGVGTVAATLEWTPASCSGIAACNSDLYFYGSPPSSVRCRDSGTDAALVTFTCSLKVVAFG